MSSSLLCANIQNAYTKEYKAPLKMGRAYLDISGGPLNLKDSVDGFVFNSSFFGAGISYRFYPKRIGVKKGMEYGLDIYPNLFKKENEYSMYVEGKAGLTHYFAPEEKNSNYMIVGGGVSTYRYYFIYTAFGREFNRLSAISKKIELNLSTTPTSTNYSLYGSPKVSGTHAHRIKLIIGIGF